MDFGKDTIMLAFTAERIRTLCGVTGYKRGETMARQGQVMVMERDDEERCSRAVVQDQEVYHVQVDIDGADFHAECECGAYGGYYPYCKHIAAVLIQMLEEEKNGGVTDERRRGEVLPLPTPGITSRDIRLTGGLIGIFDKAAEYTRVKAGQRLANALKETLSVEFLCKITDEYLPDPKFRIEMKLGLKKPYVVQNIRQLLLHIEEGKPLPFTKLFTYNPAEHTFRDEDWAVIEQLMHIAGSEFAYDETGRFYAGFSSSGNQRLMTVPPLAWDSLLPRLIAAGALLERDFGEPAQMEAVEGNLPVTFEISSGTGEAYGFEIRGLQRVKIMNAYRCAVLDGRIYRVPERELFLLSEMKSLLYRHDHTKIQVSPHQMDALMEKVVPGLRGIGRVSVDSTIRDRIVQPELSAKLYLDRDESVLIARVEFVYGGIVIDALADDWEARKDSDLILVRDSEKEKNLLDLLNGSDFIRLEKEWSLDLAEEESVYDVLFHLLPKFASWVEVYATDSVKQMMHVGRKAPKIKADTDQTTNWLEISFELDGISEKEIRKILLSIVEKKKYYRLPEGSYLSLEGEAFQLFGELYEEMGMKKGDVTGSRMQLPVFRGLQLRDRDNDSLKLGKSLRVLLDHMLRPEHGESALPAELETVLRDYQKEGFQWLKTLGSYRFGGILADDMGLGKTLQSIAFILSEAQEQAVGKPVLIVAPASLVYNWENEFHRFAPSLKVEVLLGARKERNEMLLRMADLETGLQETAEGSISESDADVIITSYPSLRKDIRIYREMAFSTLILDEAQAIKNASTQTAQAVREVTAGRRFALTGTPIENSVDELWSIFDAVFPGLFSGLKNFRGLSRDRIARMVQPFILRRLRADVLEELPDRIETMQQSELSRDQKKLYAAYLEEFKEETIRDLEFEGFQRSRMKILAGITRLRQLCCHPALFVDGYEGESGKLQQLLEVAQDCLESGRRMLIFSQFTSMLRIIRSELGKLGIPVFYLDGQTPAKERVDMCSRFNGGEHDVFLISLKAGGTGLNLTGADTVILYDLWWNPAVEEQAAGRAHRMGQKNVVQVIRLVTKGTVEEKMMELQQRKKDLIREVMEPGIESQTALTEQEIRELLML
ncbi:SNF2 helicase associated domain-containing protein [Paenibacillus sp.]|jgi:superfamily II DNA or RNA helicase|uniref:DEAD/DEAH box helicase n=1 Tax=Paenibacillus sp. TaxID=58172 RepID=UPI002817C776|nr:SNF2 helicase associated domain-containing protein [Paenibacillus sp.]MDR0270252.1 DEAD/DEAH box helicase [Paenibacillus sp.]